MDACPPEEALLDRLDDPATAAHLATCAACRSLVDIVGALRGVASGHRPEPGPGAEAAVYRAIGRAARPGLRRPSTALRWAAGLLLAATAGLAGVWTLRAEAFVARIVAADGQVVVLRAGVGHPAATGMGLREGDRLDVPADASATITLGEEGRAEVGPETSLTLHDTAAGRPLELLAGSLDVDADRPLSVRTPEARAEVVDTRFTVGADGGETHLRVAEGSVHFVRTGDGASVEVAGGHRSVADDEGTAALESRPCRPGTVLLIEPDGPAPAHFARFNRLVGDRLLGRRLRHLAFRVAARPHDRVTAADLVGRPLVIVSHFEDGLGVEASLERIGLRAAPVPVLCLEPAAFPSLAMTGPARGVDYDWQLGATGVTILDPADPLAGGLAGTRRDLFDRPGCFGWARPAVGARTVAAVEGDASRAVLFAFEAGARMAAIDAPARRVGLFLDPSQVGDGEASEPAWGLVESAVDWCVEPAGAVELGRPR